MAIAEAVRTLAPEAVFDSSCTCEELLAAEQALGHPLPAPLPELYLAFNGFKSFTDAGFLYPLQFLVEHNHFLRSESYMPPFLKRAVIFGDDGTGPGWGLWIDGSPGVFRCDAEWGTDYEDCGASVLDAWAKGRALYEKASKP